jgi:hypothetical protein
MDEPPQVYVPGEQLMLEIWGAGAASATGSGTGVANTKEKVAIEARILRNCILDFLFGVVDDLKVDELKVDSEVDCQIAPESK